MIPTTRHSGKGKAMERIKRSVAASCWGKKGGMNKRRTEDFWGSETILYDSVMVNT